MQSDYTSVEQSTNWDRNPKVSVTNGQCSPDLHLANLCHLHSPRISNLGYSLPRSYLVQDICNIQVLMNGGYFASCEMNGGMSNLDIINSFIFSMLPTYKAGNAEQQTNER